ncbi:MAG: alanine--tRNA ligase [Sphingobacteriales bacterium]|jgi:alanyl-tRNA synthetase
MTSAEIRQKFLDFFASKEHAIVPSAPIVIKNDPTLLFTNAGMNPFKDYFLGNKPAPHKRIADTQKCLRVSGKHNDLEEVGVDTYHHTMFEMLGNWSFGDYFKTEAIAWSWDLLTNIYGIPKDRLYVTVFQGDEKEGLPKDEEAYLEWKKWIAEDRILMGNKKDNFWEMGDTGPCGPCSEIHVDCRPDAERQKQDGRTLVNADHPQVIEIWNNVFMQFNRLKTGELESLPEKHVDTGMGLERLVRVLQGKSSNYDTDIFTHTISAVEKIVGIKYEFSDSKKDIAFRVIADHIRAIAFTIADGQLPSNTGAGYVIRRILRRAVRYYYSYLNCNAPLLHHLVPVLSDQFSNVFSELKQQEDFVKKVVNEEEESFLRTLEKGLRKIEDLTQGNDKLIKGSDAFELLDTYGFPIDLTRLVANEKGFDVDESGFEKEMLKQKERSRAATAIDAEDWVIVSEASSSFVGYTELETSTEIIKYRKVKGKGQEAYQVVLRQTPFYAESGGQVGDKGTLTINGKSYKVIDTKKENDLIIHLLPELPGELTGSVNASVDIELRNRTAMHHSATHLLHAALRQVLGAHVAQKGSLVNADYLRFDFSHFAKMTTEEIQQVSALVNQKIRENIPVVIKELPKEEALKLGAMALFGEKYGDVVRVVIMDPSYSIELCGGTHAGSTGELGFFILTSEAAVAAGVRRVEALAGASAEQFMQHEMEQLRQIKEVFKNPKDLLKSIEQLQEDSTELKKQIERLEGRMLAGICNELLQKNELIHNIPFIGQIVEVPHAEALKKLCFDLRHRLSDHLIVLAATIGGKPAVAIGISDSIVEAKQLDAGKIIKETVAPLIKGGGGGQKTLATAGGQDHTRLEEVITAVRSLL